MQRDFYRTVHFNEMSACLSVYIYIYIKYVHFRSTGVFQSYYCGPHIIFQNVIGMSDTQLHFTETEKCFIQLVPSNRTLSGNWWNDWKFTRMYRFMQLATHVKKIVISFRKSKTYWHFRFIKFASCYDVNLKVVLPWFVFLTSIVSKRHYIKCITILVFYTMLMFWLSWVIKRLRRSMYLLWLQIIVPLDHEWPLFRVDFFFIIIII